MRWQRLFDDLEAQLARLEAAELRADVAEHTRAERGQVRLLDRFAAELGRPVQLQLQGAGRVDGTVVEVGQDWLLLGEGPGQAPVEVLVAVPALLTARGLGGRAEPAATSPVRRFDLRRALRALSRDRAAVRVVTRDGTDLTGTIDAVRADHLDLAEHAEGSPRRAAEVRGTVVLPYAALATVRRV